MRGAEESGLHPEAEQGSEGCKARGAEWRKTLRLVHQGRAGGKETGVEAASRPEERRWRSGVSWRHRGEEAESRFRGHLFSRFL